MATELAGVPKACPRLRHLALSMLYDNGRMGRAGPLLWKEKVPFLQEVCVVYATMPTTVPLQLKSLRLGFGMCIHHTGESESCVTNPVNFLESS